MKNRFMTMLTVILLSLTFCFPVSAAAGRESAPRGTEQHSLSSEELSDLLDYVREKWDEDGFQTEDEILSAISEGEKRFGVSLGDEAKEQLAGVILKFDELGLNHDAAISLAEKLYDKYGDSLADHAHRLYDEYGSDLADNVEKIIKEELAGPVGEAIKEQVIEPAKEAVKEAAGNAVKDFWRDLKDSVVSFFENIFG